MNLQEIRKSGILEIYCIGECSNEEISIVEAALDQYPELKADISEISKVLEYYAKTQSVTPSDGLKDKIMSEARSNSISSTQTTTASPNLFNWLTGLLGVTSLVLAGLFFQKNSEMNTLKAQKSLDEIKCDSLIQQSEQQYAILEDLQNTSNRLLPFTATEKYTDVNLTFIHNDKDRKNYIQVLNLPSIASNQSYQLWSLKTDQAPIPLTVFQGNEGIFIPVDFEPETGTYAITVEPFGGQDSPTLSNLVATVGV